MEPNLETSKNGSKENQNSDFEKPKSPKSNYSEESLGNESPSNQNKIIQVKPKPNAEISSHKELPKFETVGPSETQKSQDSQNSWERVSQMDSSHRDKNENRKTTKSDEDGFHPTGNSDKAERDLNLEKDSNNLANPKVYETNDNPQENVNETDVIHQENTTDKTFPITKKRSSLREDNINLVSARNTSNTEENQISTKKDQQWDFVKTNLVSLVKKTLAQLKSKEKLSKIDLKKKKSMQSEKSREEIPVTTSTRYRRISITKTFKPGEVIAQLPDNQTFSKNSLQSRTSKGTLKSGKFGTSSEPSAIFKQTSQNSMRSQSRNSSILNLREDIIQYPKNNTTKTFDKRSPLFENQISQSKDIETLNFKTSNIFLKNKIRLYHIKI